MVDSDFTNVYLGPAAQGIETQRIHQELGFLQGMSCRFPWGFS
jgi:hypothetical protein